MKGHIVSSRSEKLLGCGISVTEVEGSLNINVIFSYFWEFYNTLYLVLLSTISL